MIDLLLRTALPGTAAVLAWWTASRLLGERLPAVWHDRALKLALALFLIPVWLLASRAAAWTAPLAASPAPAPAVSVPAAAVPAPAAPIVPSPAVEAAPVSLPVDTLTMLTIVWALGAVGILVCRLLAYRRFRREVLLDSRPVTNKDALAALEDCRVRLGIRKPVALLEKSGLGTPLSTGILRPKVILPAEGLEGELLRCVLLHELTHIRRHDLTVRLLAMLAAAVHWYDPLSYVLQRAIRRVGEERCDEEAAAAMDRRQRFAYGSLLLQMAAEAYPPEWAAPLSAKDTLERRLYAVLHPEKLKGKKKFLALLLSAVIVCCGAAAALAARNPIVEGTEPGPPVKTLGTEAATPSDPAPEASELLQKLQDSITCITCEGQTFGFTLPEEEADWTIHIAGRSAAAGGMSVHYLEDAAWVPGQTYAFTAPLDCTELTMDAAVGDESASIDLLAYRIVEDVRLFWPLADFEAVVSSFYGTWTNPRGQEVLHDCLDIAASAGEAILAAADGTVSETGYNGNRGNYLVIDHGNGLSTVYSACRDVSVKTGDTVKRGDTVGTVGSSGRSTGPHLCFRVLKDGQAQDPLAWFAPGVQPQLPETPKTAGPGAGNPSAPGGQYRNRQGATPASSQEPAALHPDALRGDEALILSRGGTLLPDDEESSYCAVNGVWYKLFLTKSALPDSNLPGGLACEEYLVGNIEAVDERYRPLLSKLVDGEYPKNSRGETYGDMRIWEYVGYLPELEGGYVGVNGQRGYIRRSDEASLPQNLSEEECPHQFLVPLYDSEGVQIDRFTVSCGGHLNTAGMSAEEAKQAVAGGN